MPVITLLTDFGTQDAYVGIMKGVILTINPQATIVDITHGIPPQDLHKAAIELANACGYFPAETVHLAVVDPGVGGTRAAVALRKNRHTFLAPDNGILSLLLATDEPAEVFKIVNDDYFLKPVSRTFHGRDVFAPAGAHLSLGLPLRHLGPRLDPATLMLLDLSKARLESDGRLSGAVASVDRFGNLTTNFDWALVKTHYPAAEGYMLTFTIGRHRVHGLSPSYESRPPGTPVALVGSRGSFEIAVNRGSAARHFAAEAGTPITLWIEDHNKG